MSEKKVAKVDAATIVIRRENGDKIVARGSCFEGEQVTVLAGQVLEVRREEGSVVLVVRDKPKAPPTLDEMADFIDTLDLGNVITIVLATEILNFLQGRP